MGKGDIKSRRGKLFNKSYGKRRPRKKQVKGPFTGVNQTEPQSARPVEKPAPSKEKESKPGKAAPENKEEAKAPKAEAKRDNSK